jgi:hypothetical protein
MTTPSGAGAISGSSIGRNRHTARASNPTVATRRCLTCKKELSGAAERYCDDACLLKFGRSIRAPGRRAAHRRRKRGR